MATQIAERQQNKVPVVAGAKLAAFIPQTLDEAWKLAGALAHSGMTPKSYGTDQNKIMVGMMAGAELGLTPMVALQSIAVIGNNPSIWGDGAIGLIQASGLLEDQDEQIIGDGDKMEAVCTLTRKGRKTPIVGRFSVEKAKLAGLWKKSGPWTQYPERMLQMRARAFALRDGFADVLKGLHIVEEARDYAPMDGGQLQAQPLTGQALLEQAAAEPEHVEHTEEPPAAAIHPGDDPAAVRADAEKWLAKYESDVTNAGSMEELEQVHAKASRAMKKLETLFPDLHAKAAALAHTPEGRAEEQMGEETFGGRE